MNDDPRDLFLDILNKYGKDIFKDPRKFENVLNDFFKGRFQKERNILIDSISEGVPQALLSRSSIVPYDVMMGQCIDRMLHWGFDRTLARWVVDSWALGFEIQGKDAISLTTGSVDVTSSPGDAKVYLDEIFKGKTPLTLHTVAAGSHALRCTLQDHQDWETKLEIAAGSHTDVNAVISILAKTPTVAPAPIIPEPDGTLDISTSPEGAEIYLDSQFIGTAPVRDVGITPGKHGISVKLDGYIQDYQTITISPGARRSHSVQLQSIDLPPPVQQPEPPSVPQKEDDLKKKYIALAVIAIVIIALIVAVPGLFSKKQDTYNGVTTDAAGYIAIGNQYLKEGRFSEAIKAYDNALALEPDNTDALAGKGDALNGDKQYAKALPYLDKALVQNPKNTRALVGKAFSQYHLGNYPDSLKYIDQVLAMYPKNLDVLNSKGEILIRLGEYGKAASVYSDALKIDPKNLDALNGMGWALYKQGKYDDSITYFDRCLNLKPDDFAPLVNKGQALIGLGRYQDALPYIDKSLALMPDDPEALTAKGRALAGLGRHTEAVTYYDRALQKDPKYIEALNGKGLSLIDLGKNSEAIQYFDKILGIDPNNTDAQHNKGRALSNS